MKRKVFAWVLSVCMTFGLSACGFSQGGSSPFDSSLDGSQNDEILDTGSQDGSGNGSEGDASEGSGDASNDNSENEPSQIPDDGTMRILMVESNEGESEAFMQLLEETEYEITSLCVTDEYFPSTVEELFSYDEVILNNIANADMPEGFVDVLHSYVNDFGGGLLTVGGNKVDENGNFIYKNGIPVANAYNREDMFETLYQEMLPVRAIDYTPPVATMILIDRSGSMDTQVGRNGQTKLELAKQGAKACFYGLTERDYCGIMTLEEQYIVAMELSPMTQMASLHKAIDEITTGGGTVFGDALHGAGRALRAMKNVAKRHVVLITDGMPADTYQEYSQVIEEYANDCNAPVTFSFVIIGEDITASGKVDLQNAVELGGGRFYHVWDVDTLPRIMREEMMSPEIRAINFEEFQPQFLVENEIALGIQQELIPPLGGFYGTKLKDGAEMVLSGPWNVPIYAQWQYGKGKVGSFMCDLNGVWSSSFMRSDIAKKILWNIIDSLSR